MTQAEQHEPSLEPIRAGTLIHFGYHQLIVRLQPSNSRN